MRKPGMEIFKFVLRENNLDAAETLFIDDTRINAEGAAAAGIHALYLSGNLKVEQVFEPSFLPGPYLISSKSI
jgi:putative hydrolase of the HAD superfamily